MWQQVITDGQAAMSTLADTMRIGTTAAVQNLKESVIQELRETLYRDQGRH
jgi:hypothetical protein